MPVSADLTTKLARTVLEVSPAAKDELECSVILESLGFGDKFAARNGYENLFEMARAVYAASLNLKGSRTFERWTVEPRTLKPRLHDVAAGGLMYNVTWLVFFFLILVIGVAPFAARLLPLEAATMLSLSVVISFTVTGGLQQFTAWKTIYYLLHRNYPLVTHIFKRMLVIGFSVLLAVGAVAGLLASWLQILPPPLALELVLNIVIIGVLRLWMTPIIAMRSFGGILTVAFSMAASLALGYSFLVAPSPEYQQLRTVQTITVVTGVVVALLVSLRLLDFSRYIPQREDVPPFYSRPLPPTRVKPPRLSVLVLTGWESILYGSLYFLFMFIDRVLAAVRDSGLQYNSEFHIGADLALLLIIATASIVRFTQLFPFSRLTELVMRRTSVGSAGRVSRFLLSVYGRTILWVAVAAILVAIVAMIFSEGIITFAGGTALSLLVFRISLVANVFFALFATGAVYAMTLRRVRTPSLLLAVGTIMHVVLSLVLLGSFSTVGLSYSYLVSSIFLFATSTTYMLLTAGRGQYVLYSAF